MVGVKVGEEDRPQIVEAVPEGRRTQTRLLVADGHAFAAIDNVDGIADHDR
jgi:hypothetical protein